MKKSSKFSSASSLFPHSGRLVWDDRQRLHDQKRPSVRESRRRNGPHRSAREGASYTSHLAGLAAQSLTVIFFVWGNCGCESRKRILVFMFLLTRHVGPLTLRT